MSFACGDGGPPTDVQQYGSVSGIVREAGGAGIANVTVTAGTITATTNASGAFQLPNVPVGSVTIVVNAPAFESYTQSVAVQAGSNSHDISLTRRTIFEASEVAAHLPTTITNYRGVLYLLAGSTQDSRNFIRGQPGCWASVVFAVCPEIADFRARLLDLAQRHRLALFGARTMPANDPVAHAVLLAGITSIAEQSGHPELANAPIFLMGSSLGGCIAHGFTRLHSARVIGFMSAKGNCHFGGVSDARLVPGYFFFSDEDPVSPGAASAITAVFLDNREQGAVWALGKDLGSGHEFPAENAQVFDWIEAVLARRLPPGHIAGTPLPAVNESSGWLGNNATTTAAAYACYTANRSTASWLPDQQTASGWQTMAGGSGAVPACP